RAPMLAGREGDLPVAVRKTFPPVEFHDALEAEVAREVAHAPGHDANFWMRQFAERGFVEMIEVRVRQEHQVYGRQMLQAQAGALDAFQQKQPVRKIRVNEDV